MENIETLSKLLFFSKRTSSERLWFCEQIFSRLDIDLVFKDFLSKSSYSSNSANTDLLEIRSKIKIWAASGIKILSILDSSYPSRLRLIQDPPLVLYYKGDLNQQLNKISLCAIVGARNADTFGKNLAKSIASKLASIGVATVSGLAYGIDAAAHNGSLQVKTNLPTIAVLGNGLPGIYPNSHFKLAEQIISSGGIIISQFEPDQAAYPSNFLNRNRIIAGLAEQVIVIQAGIKSGSLVTARHALEQGKDLWVVPGDISNPRYQGSNKLIQNGAHVFCSIDDLNFLYPEKGLNRLKIASKQSLSSEMQNILKLFKNQTEIGFEDLLEKTNDSNLHKNLLYLEENAYLFQLPGRIYKRI